tara:strand:- start:333 stop:1277 length:945 start_codon:yes stop_codon:yes gene_type:complete
VKSLCLQTKNELYSKIRDINIKCDELVVGSSIEALAYSFLNNVPIVSSGLKSPFHFERFEHDQDLSVFEIDNATKTIKTNFAEKKVGISKLWLWERLLFSLSTGGLFPMIDKPVSLRISDNILKAPTSNARMAKIHYKNLIVFDDDKLQGLRAGQSSDELCKVYDWFRVRSGMKHQYDRIEDTTDFVKHILFYPSERVTGDHDFKDAVSVSYISKNDLNSFEYSDINARFKTKYMMKEAGIKGARNGRDMNDKTKFKYYDVKIENTNREIIYPKNIYNSYDNIVFNYDSFNDIINKNPLKESYVSNIFKRTCKS